MLIFLTQPASYRDMPVLARTNALPTAVEYVSTYVKSTHPCHLLPDFDDPQIESIWVKVCPHPLPRGTSALLIGTVYHPPSRSAEQNPLLISHIQRNIEAFLNSCPDGLAIVSGDFNPP